MKKLDIFEQNEKNFENLVADFKREADKEEILLADEIAHYTDEQWRDIEGDSYVDFS